MHIVVVGAGAIGTCIAYFLSQKATKNDDDISITVIEQTSVACAASGKAGGFLALDWSDDTPLGPIARKSFTLHAELAEKLNGEKKYSYRRLDTFSVLLQTGDHTTTKKQKGVRKKQNSGSISWIRQDKVLREEQLGTPTNTAQVHPGQFTQALMEAAQASGRATLTCGTGVDSLLYEEKDTVVRGVRLKDGREINADRVVIAMGPWSGQLTMKGRRRTNHLPIDGVRAHSIVFTPADPTVETVPAQALFTSVLDGTHSHEPEIYPRSDGTLYMCSATDTAEPLPPSADEVKVSEEAIEQIKLLRDTIVHPAYQGEIRTRQACYLPISRDGSPLIGAHPTHQHLYLATGHSCWGILNAPATGLMVAELLLDGAIHCIDDSDALDSVDPKRLNRADSRQKT